MKRFIIIFVTIAAYFTLTSCSMSEESDSTLVGIEDFAMADTLEGTWTVLGFEEFKAVIDEGRIIVTQGDTVLWAGTFNENMPMVGEYTILSQRDANVDLIYFADDILQLEFQVEDGVVRYQEDDAGGLDFEKVS